MVKVSKRRQSRGGGLLKKQGTLLGSSQFDDDDSDTENYMNENEENVQNASRNSNANAEATAGTGKDGSKESVSPGPEKEKTEKSGKDKSGRRRSAGGRRRSSFGGARFQNDEEQQRCVAAYTSIIKMSSENKINDKNSWNLDLIDNMGKLIKSDSNKRGVNFQKASCTIDASVKIYSHRVDDTYTHSHRVLESFSRNDTNRHNDDSDDENNGDVTKSKTASRVGGTKASNRHGLVETIEKSVENINAKEIEHEVQVSRSLSLRLRFKGLFLYTVGVLCNVEWCIT
jgi:condensin complex subunit 2